MFRYGFGSTEKAALQEIGPRFTLKLRSVRMGLLVVKKFREPSMKLGFDESDDMTTDGIQPEGEGGVEYGESESKSRNKTRPPRLVNTSGNRK